MSLHRAKHAAEEALRASGVPFAIVRPTAFMETWIGLVRQTVAEKGHALVFGPGVNPINFVSVRDVAALVVLAVEDDALRGRAIEIGGPENVGFATLAERVVDAHARRVAIKHVPLAALRVMSVLARPFSPVFARMAGAAVVMNTTDMTFESAVRERFPSVPRTTLGDAIAATR